MVCRVWHSSDLMLSYCPLVKKNMPTIRNKRLESNVSDTYVYVQILTNF